MLAQTQSRTDDRDRRLTATFLSIRSSPPPSIRHSRRSLAHRAASPPPPASASPSSSPPFTRLSLRVGTDGGRTDGRTDEPLFKAVITAASLRLRHRQRRQRRSLSSSSRPALTPTAFTGCDMASCMYLSCRLVHRLHPWLP